MLTVVVKYMYVQTYMDVCTTIQVKTLIYCLGLFSVACEHILLAWQWLWRVKHVQSFTVLCTSIIYSYGPECVIIACGHLTNMQGCRGNLYVCAECHG